MGKNKFKFTTEFQYDLLKYIVSDKNGYKALEMVSDEYFTLVEHAVIAYTLKRHYKKRSIIPGKTIFIQEILKTFESKDFASSLTPTDRNNILTIISSMYEGKVQDGDDILENVEKFAQFVDLKDVTESIDLTDYNQYESFSRKVQKAISPRVKAIDERGSFLSRDVEERQKTRKLVNPIVPTPFREINKLTNANGYARGSVLVILDRAKKFKTGMLVNIAKGYLKLRKNVLIIDLDNGEGEFMTRVEQSITGHTKSEILSGDYDQDISKKLSNRKYELVIKKMPALVTNSSHIKTYMQYLYREFGFKADILIIDYIAKMGCISGKDSLHERIGEAYIDIGNLAMEEHIEHVWTAQHVTRAAAKARMATRYDSTDIAGAIDISRHVQAIFGLNRSTEEENKGIQRMEIVDQRDGKNKGRAVFIIDMETQRAKPLKGKELEKYYEEYKEHIERVNNTDADEDNQPRPKRARSYPGANAKSDLGED